jgi:hypothetical protein
VLLPVFLALFGVVVGFRFLGDGVTTLFVSTLTLVLTIFASVFPSDPVVVSIVTKRRRPFLLRVEIVFSS